MESPTATLMEVVNENVTDQNDNQSTTVIIEDSFMQETLSNATNNNNNINNKNNKSKSINPMNIEPENQNDNNHNHNNNKEDKSKRDIWKIEDNENEYQLPPTNMFSICLNIGTSLNIQFDEKKIKKDYKTYKNGYYDVNDNFEEEINKQEKDKTTRWLNVVVGNNWNGEQIIEFAQSTDYKEKELQLETTFKAHYLYEDGSDFEINGFAWCFDLNLKKNVMRAKLKHPIYVYAPHQSKLILENITLVKRSLVGFKDLIPYIDEESM